MNDEITQQNGITPARALSKIPISDLLAGLAASAVVLPQAMAFGVALLTPQGFDAADGALTGLTAAAILCLISGAFGATLGLITAPTGPTLVLLAGALASVNAAGVEGADLLMALTAIMVTTGFWQIAIGASGGGNLIKLMPYPVVVGFMTGSAILMIGSQIKPLSGTGATAAWADWIFVPALIAAATFAITRLAPRFIKVPGTIAGLIGGTVLFQIIILFGPGPVPESWIIGVVPSLDPSSFGFELAALKTLPWGIILSSSLALAVLASIDTLLTCVIADVQTGVHHNSRRELIAQGMGQLASGCAGGMAGAGTTGATVISVNSGGRRWAALTAGLTFVLLVLFFGPVGTVLPISVLAGIILHVAVKMLDPDIIAWARKPRTRLDAVIAILVTIITVGVDLMVAVGIGVGIAIIIFVRNEIKAPIIHRRSTGSQLISVRARPEKQRELLEIHGNRIVLYELRGNLFFATADQLFEELTADLKRPDWIILHMRRISQVDMTGIKILRQIAARLESNGGQLIFCSVHQGIGIGHDVNQSLQNINPKKKAPHVETFNGTDEALDWAEDQLLIELGEHLIQANEKFPLGESDLCVDMNDSQIRSLGNILHLERIAKGETVFSSGAEGNEVYIVLRGEVDIRLPTTEHHYKRLAKYGPKTFFGEIAFFDPGPRTAAAVAVSDCDLLVLDREGFNHLEPDIAAVVLFSLGRAQGTHLRWAADELTRLLQW